VYPPEFAAAANVAVKIIADYEDAGIAGGHGPNGGRIRGRLENMSPDP